MEELVELIKSKKELKGIDDKYVKKILDKYLKENNYIVEKYEKSKSLKQFVKSIEYKIMLKEVRAVLREVYGAFVLQGGTRMKKTLEKIKQDPSLENHKKLLLMHRSSKERFPYYEEVYKKIFEITGKPKIIMDLACGLNPISYPFLGCEPEYLASDISPEIEALIQDYFDSQAINGTSFVFDLLEYNPKETLTFASSDVCFLFKTLDSLETMKRGTSEGLIVGIPAKYLVISFARQSLGGKKKIADSRRKWLEKMLQKHDLQYDFFQVENESFYVVKKV